MPGFLGLEFSTLTETAPCDVAIIGAKNATPYEHGKPSHSKDAPAAIRAASQKFANWHTHYDFDTGRELLEPAATVVRDLGDIDCDPASPADNRDKIRSAVSSVLEARATPIVLGGDDSVPIPVLQGFENHGPVWIVQIDAHIDWRQERFGEPLGWSSTMRRASEMEWVEGIIQIGARGVGSALRSDIEDAKNWGAQIFTAREISAHGVSFALKTLPEGVRVVISLDCDAFDPSIMPGVMAQVPGGLTYWHMIEILEIVASKSSIAGCSVVELAPQRDIGNISALTVARILCNMVAATERPLSKP